MSKAKQELQTLQFALENLYLAMDGFNTLNIALGNLNVHMKLRGRDHWISLPRMLAVLSNRYDEGEMCYINPETDEFAYMMEVREVLITILADNRFKLQER